LGFGFMRLPLRDSNDPSSVDMDQTKRMVDMFLERGFGYFDTAFQYHGGRSEEFLREAVVSRYPRSRFTVTDKLPCWEIHSHDDLERVFSLQLEHTGAGYFDWYLLHAMNKHYVELMDSVGGWDFVARKKEEGFIRHIGFSFHDDSETLSSILLSHPEMEYVQLQINYIDWNSPSIESGTCYDLCEKYNRKVMVMEPLKGGSLARVPESVEKMFRDYDPDSSPASWAIRFVASLPRVQVVLSGMSSLSQVEDNTSYMMNFRPLDDEQRVLIDKASEVIQSKTAIPCTGCNYCAPLCPKKIAIPEYFSMINYLKQFGSYQKHNTAKYYELLIESRGRAGDCIGCGRCESRCPQHIPIREKLEMVSRLYDTDEKE